MIEIDGSYREGGGQILRTALSLSCLFQKPFRIFNIRKGRKKPGLMPQHLTCVRASQLIANAKVKGDDVGSTELLFSPGEVKSGDFFFDIGTAGSTSLVLQTVIPSLIFSKAKTTVTLKGGTHVPFSPSYDYLAGVFSSFLKKIGVNIKLSIESYGFYPKGGGKVRAEILPVQEIKSLKIAARGNILRMSGYSGVGNLPFSIAERQKNALVERVHSDIRDLRCPVIKWGFENIDMNFLMYQHRGRGRLFICNQNLNIQSPDLLHLVKGAKWLRLLVKRRQKNFMPIIRQMLPLILIWLTRSFYTSQCVIKSQYLQRPV